VLTPSDHGVADERCYRRGLDAAVSDVARTNRAVLLAVRPSAPNEDYGWIEPAVAAPWPMVQPVASFVEKPPVDHARRLYANGALWNTMVVVARARFVFDLYRAHLPQVASVFEAVLAVPPRVRDGFLQAEYARLPVADFSRDVLMPARGLSVYAWPSSMGWSDLGTPERLRRWLGVEPKVRARATLPAAAATA
jgi:mannose-1-phosphate guanylyltransferase